MFRGQFGFIPMAAFPFFGVLLGLILSRKEQKKPFLQISFTVITGLLILTGIFLIIYGIPDLTLSYWPVTMATVNLIIMFLVMTLTIIRFEYAPKHLLRKRAQRSLFFRRFNMITLTIFVFESIIAVLWAKLFMLLIIDPFPYNVPADITYLFCVIGTWYVILRLWEKINYKFSIEWCIMKLIGRITGTTSQKLDVQTVLYHPLSETDKKTSQL